MTDEFVKLLDQGCVDLGVTLSDQQKEQFFKYYEMLIEKNKVDIYDIPISEITSQYLDYIRSMEEEDLDVMSDFLVMAATLLKIKAKMLLPVKEEEEEEGDPREELVRRLIEYKIYKYASLQLKEREMMAEKSFFRSPDIPPQVLAYREEIDPVQMLSEVTLQRSEEHTSELQSQR